MTNFDLKSLIMKNIILLISCLVSLNVIGQNVIAKISPFHLIDGTFYTSIEKEFISDHSVNISSGYRLSDNGDDKGWMGEVQLRKYLFTIKSLRFGESSLSGVFGALYGNAKYFSELEDYDGLYPYDEGYYQDYYEKYEIKQGEAGVLMGIQLVVQEKVSLDFFIGGGLRVSDVEGKTSINFDPESPQRGYTGIVPKIGLDFGIVF